MRGSRVELHSRYAKECFSTSLCLLSELIPSSDRVNSRQGKRPADHGIYTGRHRSVAMAERLAKEIEQWDRIVVKREHLDTDVETGLTRKPRMEAGNHK